VDELVNKTNMYKAIQIHGISGCGKSWLLGQLIKHVSQSVLQISLNEKKFGNGDDTAIYSKDLIQYIQSNIAHNTIVSIDDLHLLDDVYEFISWMLSKEINYKFIVASNEKFQSELGFGLMYITSVRGLSPDESAALSKEFMGDEMEIGNEKLYHLTQGIPKWIQKLMFLVSKNGLTSMSEETWSFLENKLHLELYNELFNSLESSELNLLARLVVSRDGVPLSYLESSGNTFDEFGVRLIALGFAFLDAANLKVSPVCKSIFESQLSNDSKLSAYKDLGLMLTQSQISNIAGYLEGLDYLLEANEPELFIQRIYCIRELMDTGNGTYIKTLLDLLQKYFDKGFSQNDELLGWLVLLQLFLCGESKISLINRIKNPFKKVYALAKYHGSKGRVKKAIDVLKDGFVFCKTNGEKLDFWIFLAGLYRLDCKFSHAKDCLRSAKPLIQKEPTLEQLAFYHRQFGLVCANYNEFCDAEEHFSLALEVYDEMGRLISYSVMAYWYAFILMKLGRYKDCDHWIDKSMDFQKSCGNDFNIATCYALRAKVFLRRKELEKALEQYDKSLAISKEHGFVNLISEYLRERARIFVALGRFSDAEESLKEARVTGSNLEDSMARTLIEQISIELDLIRGDIHNAEKTFAEVSRQANLIKHPEISYRALRLKQEIAKFCGSFDTKEIDDEFLVMEKSLDSRQLALFEEYFDLFKLGLSQLNQIVFNSRNQGRLLLYPFQLESHLEKDNGVDICLNFVKEEFFVCGEETDFKGKRILVPLLLQLSKTPGKVYSEAELYKLVWGAPFMEESSKTTFRMSLSRLRKLLKNQLGIQFIQTVSKQGYCFNPNCNYQVIYSPTR
jgi:tetratricopeptide (TPR) repeat protein